MSYYTKKDSDIGIATPQLNPEPMFWESVLASPALDPIQLQFSPQSKCNDYKETMSPLVLSSSCNFLKSFKNNYQVCILQQNNYRGVKMTNNIETIMKKFNSSNQKDDIIRDSYHLYNVSKNTLNFNNFKISSDVKIDMYLKNCILIASFLSLCTKNLRNYLLKLYCCR